MGEESCGFFGEEVIVQPGRRGPDAECGGHGSLNTSLRRKGSLIVSAEIDDGLQHRLSVGLTGGKKHCEACTFYVSVSSMYCIFMADLVGRVAFQSRFHSLMISAHERLTSST
jgi:hypothetical protein